MYKREDVGARGVAHASTARSVGLKDAREKDSIVSSPPRTMASTKAVGSSSSSSPVVEPLSAAFGCASGARVDLFGERVAGDEHGDHAERTGSPCVSF